jgi:hypothetical protein
MGHAGAANLRSAAAATNRSRRLGRSLAGATSLLFAFIGSLDSESMAARGGQLDLPNTMPLLICQPGSFVSEISDRE